MHKFNPENFDFMTDEEFDALFGVDEILEVLRQIPDEYITVLNPQRYKEVMCAITRICSIVNQTDKDAIIEVDYDELTKTSIVLNISTEYFVVRDIEEFCNTLSVASTFDISPISGGLFEIGITFDDVNRMIKKS